LKDILVVVFLVLEGPSCLKDEAVFFREDRHFAVGIEFKGLKSRRDPAEEKKGLLGGNLVREENRLGQGDIDLISGGEQSIEELGVVLEEGPFYAFCRLGEERKSQEEREKADADHIRMVSQVFLNRQAGLFFGLRLAVNDGS
jgi:hypothetical protein